MFSLYRKLIKNYNCLKQIYVYQYAPANWVSMIEKGAQGDIKNKIVNNDMENLLSNVEFNAIDIVGFFCAHYPVFEKEVVNNIKETRALVNNIFPDSQDIDIIKIKF